MAELLEAQIKVYLHNLAYHFQVVKVSNYGAAIYTKTRSRLVTSPSDIEKEVAEAKSWALWHGYQATWSGLVNSNKPLPFVPED